MTKAKFLCELERSAPKSRLTRKSDESNQWRKLAGRYPAARLDQFLGDRRVLIQYLLASVSASTA